MKSIALLWPDFGLEVVGLLYGGDVSASNNTILKNAMLHSKSLTARCELYLLVLDEVCLSPFTQIDQHCIGLFVDLLASTESKSLRLCCDVHGASHFVVTLSSSILDDITLQSFDSTSGLNTSNRDSSSLFIVDKIRYRWCVMLHLACDTTISLCSPHQH